MTKLVAKKREKEDLDIIRQSGILPGVVYGPEREPVKITLDYNEFEKTYNDLGESTLIDFEVEGDKEPVKVLIQDIQYDPVKNKMIHFDLRQIKMGEEMNVNVELNFVGESSVLKEGGTLVRGKDYIEIRCLPKDLISEIEVDISKLETYDDVILVKDLPTSEGVKVLHEGDELIAKVSAPMSEEELKAMDEAEAPSVEDVKVEGEKKEEGSEGEKKEEKEEKKEEKK